MARKRDSSNGNPSVAVAAPHGPQPKPFTARQLRAFQLVVGVAALWWLVLLIGVITASNPPSLDAFLVEQADFVVEARLESQDAGQLKVLNCWRNPTRKREDFCDSRSEISREIFPTNVRVQGGVTYLLPVQEVEGKLRWLSTAMYDRHGEEPGKPKPAMVPIPATSLTRLELKRALEDLERPLTLDGVELEPRQR
ncbi:MAG: hypothetical protein KDA68_18910 [Planctomycetaceae bacterium]|nr:hypothetical protein [Planctomycetaceae bacterium]